MANPIFIGLLQAFGLVVYISLVATFMNNAVKWFGQLNNIFAPIIMLTLLSLSVLVCGFISLGYPIVLFWIKKKPKKALKVVAFTAFFLLVFFALFVAGVVLLK